MTRDLPAQTLLQRSIHLTITPELLFAQRLKDVRERKKIAAADIAKAIKVSPHCIDDWESGRRAPRLGSALRWAAALGCGIDLKEPDAKA